MSTKHLRAAATKRTEDATRRTTDALVELRSTGEPITFAAVARTAGVSTDFLYRNPTIRTRIEALRSTAEYPTSAEPPAGASANESSVVRSLGRQLKDLKTKHRDEIKRLENALAAAHGENLRLRRELDLAERKHR